MQQAGEDADPGRWGQALQDLGPARTAMTANALRLLRYAD